MAPGPPSITHWGRSEGALSPPPPAKGPELKKILAALSSPLDPEVNNLMLLPVGEDLSHFAHFLGFLSRGLPSQKTAGVVSSASMEGFQQLSWNHWLARKVRTFLNLTYFHRRHCRAAQLSINLSSEVTLPKPRLRDLMPNKIED